MNGRKVSGRDFGAGNDRDEGDLNRTKARRVSAPYERPILRLALLAPDIQRGILTGRQSRRMNLDAVMRSDVPLAWAAQRRMFASDR